MPRALLFLALLVAGGVGAQDVDALARSLQGNDYDDVRRAADQLLGLGSVAATEALAEGLGAEMTYARDYVFEKWTARPAEAGLQWVLNKGLTHKDARVRRNLVELLAVWQAGEATRYLDALLAREREPAVRAQMARTLAALGATDSVDKIERLTRSRDWWERASALEALAALDLEAARPHLDKALKDRDPYVHTAGLVLLHEHDAAAGLVRAIDDSRDPNWQVRAAAIEILGRSRNKDAVGPLIDRLGAEAGRLQHDAWAALRRLTGMNMPDNAEMWQGWWDRSRDAFDPAAVPEVEPGAAGGGAADDPGGSRVSYYGLVIYSQRVVFGLDLSGSMEDPVGTGQTKLSIAKDELKTTLSKFQRGMYFNLIFFPTVLQPWKNRLQASSPATIAAALKFIAERKAHDNPGGNRGNLYDALVHAMDDPTTDSVYVLSDGRPSAGEYQFSDRFMKHFLARNRYTRIEVHTILVGTGRTDREFMEELARQTGGQHVAR